MSQFEFRDEQRIAEDDDPDQTDLKTPYMNGAQIELLLANWEQIFGNLFDNAEKII